MSAYPEHEKLAKIADQSQTCGEFLEWLQGQGLHLMRFGPIPDRLVCRSIECIDGKVRRGGRSVGCPRCDGTGFEDVEVQAYHSDSRSITTLLAEFFEIDQNKIEAEKRAMLDEIRAANA